LERFGCGVVGEFVDDELLWPNVYFIVEIINREPPLRPLVLSKHVLSSDWFEDEVVVIDIKEIVRQVGNKLNQELDRGRVECWENALVVISPGGQELVVGVESNRNVRAIFGGREMPIRWSMEIRDDDVDALDPRNILTARENNVIKNKEVAIACETAVAFTLQRIFPQKMFVFAK
jgi:hypothetical protein